VPTPRLVGMPSEHVADVSVVGCWVSTEAKEFEQIGHNFNHTADLTQAKSGSKRHQESCPRPVDASLPDLSLFRMPPRRHPSSRRRGELPGKSPVGEG
jgi:hypothetical protein